MSILSGHKKYTRYRKNTDGNYQIWSQKTFADTVEFEDGRTLKEKFVNMKGASSSAAGSSGLVPAPAAGSQTKYLRADGTWQTPPNTTYGIASSASSGIMSSADKAKLDGIDANANNYIHPNSHPANIISQDSEHRFITDAQISNWNAKVNSSQIANFKNIVFSTSEPTTVPDDTIVFVYGNE